MENKQNILKYFAHIYLYLCVLIPALCASLSVFSSKHSLLTCLFQIRTLLCICMLWLNYVKYLYVCMLYFNMCTYRNTNCKIT